MFCQPCLSFQRTSCWICYSFVLFFKTLFHLFLVWSLLFPSFYSLWAVFVVLFQVPLSVKLDCLFELLLNLSLACNAWISLLGPLFLCPMDLGVVVFLCSFISRYLLISSLISLLTHSLFNNMLFSFQVFAHFSVFFLWLISGFIALWSDKMLDMISIFLNLLRLVLWPNMCSHPGKCSMCAWKDCILCCFVMKSSKNIN